MRASAKTYKQRYLYNEIIELALSRNKMALVSGPRQVGKTTLAKSLIGEFDETQYKNWDESHFRKQWITSPNAIVETFNLSKLQSSRLLILDEIHKSKGWKQKLKGIFDEYGEDLGIVVTGSARLNTFRKGGDSLMGRYLGFRLHPLSYGEVLSEQRLLPDDWKKKLFLKPSQNLPQKPLSDLLELSGFPEPYYSGSKKIQRIWSTNRNEKIVREDLRDLSRLPELSQVEMLTSLLPEKIGSPLSVQSLREDLEVAHDTVSRWLRYLNELFYFFELKPWSKSVPRSLKKEGKIYLYDWTSIANEGIKFENLIACHLLKACHYWSDTGEGQFALHYLRNKEKQEVDFVIIKDKRPWLCVEAKMASTKLDTKVIDKFVGYLKCPFVQVTLEEKIWRAWEDRVVLSATTFLSDLP